jgi:tight adherence protein C
MIAMLSTIDRIADTLGADPRHVVLMGLLLGTFLVFLAIVSALRDRTAALIGRRMRMDGAADIFVTPDRAPTGFARAFLPTETTERNKVRRDLAHAGFDSPNAVVAYYLLRVGVGLLLPVALAASVVMREQLPLPDALRAQMGQLGPTSLMIGFAALVVLGFFGPAVWLRARAGERRDTIEKAFPNALDLLQVSVESGLGFDAALARVADELAIAAPEVSSEFRLAQQEIFAGRDRERAYQTMAERLGIDEAHAFVNVVLQSFRFGTSLSQALLAYSSEMRQRREILAQEKANKLPVYMSAVMAGLMMPALLIVTIGPVVLRYMQSF